MSLEKFIQDCVDGKIQKHSKTPVTVRLSADALKSIEQIRSSIKITRQTFLESAIEDGIKHALELLATQPQRITRRR